jgi:hypothetical protein
MSNNNSIDFLPTGTIDFEPVEIPSVHVPPAPAADDKIDLDPLSINFGREKAHRPAATERMLAGTTIDWLIAFPMEARPKALCERFPHVANRLAHSWADRARARASLEALVADGRWGSAGYPAMVQGELRRLLERLG